MDRPTSRPIVVALDGSDGSAAALAWAAEAARRRGAPLRLVNVVEPAFAPARWLALGASAETVRDTALAVLSAAVVDLEATGLVVEPVLESGTATRALLDHAADAAMLVVGSRGYGGFAQLLVGSTSLQVAAHAPVPVVVVRATGAGADADTAGDVVVGIDGAEVDAAVLDFAFEEAAGRGVGLTAVYAWLMPNILVPVADAEWTRSSEEEAAAVAERLAAYEARYPGVRVTQRIVEDDAVQALADASADAVLTVVGRRGHGGFRGLLIGSVSHGVLHHAASPVAVLPSEPES